MPEAVRPDRGRMIEEFLAGEPSAVCAVDGWADLVLHRHYASLRDVWEDLRQEVRLRVFRNLRGGQFDGRADLRTYVHRITMNVCIDHTRKASRRREEGAGVVESGEVIPFSRPDAAPSCIARDFLLKVLDALPDEDRLLVHLVFVELHPYSAVARLLGIPEGTVKSRMFRCKQKILKARSDLLRGGEPLLR